MPAAEASMIAPWPIERPVRQPWEIRVVVWRTRKVPAADLGGFTDMYLRLFQTGHVRRRSTVVAAFVAASLKV